MKFVYVVINVDGEVQGIYANFTAANVKAASLAGCDPHMNEADVIAPAESYYNSTIGIEVFVEKHRVQSTCRI